MSTFLLSGINKPVFSWTKMEAIKAKRGIDIRVWQAERQCRRIRCNKDLRLNRRGSFSLEKAIITAKHTEGHQKADFVLNQSLTFGKKNRNTVKANCVFVLLRLPTQPFEIVTMSVLDPPFSIL